VKCPKIMAFEEQYLKTTKQSFEVGDTIKVHTKIIEGNKERIQAFSGIVIAKKGGGLSETFTVYRSAYGTSMERVFLLNSPRVEKIEVEKKGRVRRAKLYYLQGKSGKKAKVKEKIFKSTKNKAKEVAPEPKTEEENPST